MSNFQVELMDTVAIAEDVQPDDELTEVEKETEPPCLFGDVDDFPIDVEGDEYNVIPDARPQLWLQRYQLQELQSGKSKALYKEVEKAFAEKEQLKHHKPVEFIVGSTSNNTVAVKLEDTEPGGGNDGGVPVGAVNNSVGLRRGRGRPRKVKSKTALNNKDDQVVKVESMSRCGKGITRSAAKGFLSPGDMAYKRKAVPHRLKTGFVSSNPEPVPKRSGRPPSIVCSDAEEGKITNRGEQSRGKYLKRTKSVKASPVGVVNIPRKRGRPRKNPVIEIPTAELCSKCYLKVSVKFGKTLYNDVLHVVAVRSAVPAERGLVKRPRGRPRKGKGQHPTHLPPKEEVDCMGAVPSYLEETRFNSTTNG